MNDLILSAFLSQSKPKELYPFKATQVFLNGLEILSSCSIVSIFNFDKESVVS
jgi:hypothetical protein